MSDPIYRFKHLPWRPLFQISALVIVSVLLLELGLELGEGQNAVLHNTLIRLYAPPLGVLTLGASAIGVGALAVYLLERLAPQVMINSSCLWALVLCLVLLVFVKSLLPINGFLVEFNQIQLIGMVIGVFWKGRPYWRYWQ